MKHLRLHRILWLTAFAMLSCISRAQQDMPTQSFDQIYTFDVRGDALIETSMQMGAIDWNTWKERFGDHPDMLLRDLRYQLAKAVIDDYTLSRDDVHRQASCKIKARALAQYKSDGDFSIDVDKTLKLVTGSGTEWFFTSSAPINGVLYNQTLKAKLPAKATNAAFSQGGDFNYLTYSIDVTPKRHRRWLWGGVGLLVLGVLLGMATVFVGSVRKTTTATIIPPPPSSPPAPPNLPPSA